MKIRVTPDCGEQKKRQTEIWTVMTEMLPPDGKKTALKVTAAGVLIAAAAAFFITTALLKLETFMYIIGVIVLLAGVYTLTNAVTDVVMRRKKIGRTLSAVDETVEKAYAKYQGLTAAEYEFTKDGITIAYFRGDSLMKKIGVKADKTGIIVMDRLAAVDFTDDDFYCFDEEEIGADNFAALKKTLAGANESYQTLIKNERGRYELADGHIE